MKFSTRSTYGLKAIVNLARHPRDERVPLSAIAREENISSGYLERIFSLLKASKIVTAGKGSAGGYRLAKDPRQISAYEIVRSLEGKNKLFYCFDDAGKVFCSKACDCGANKALHKVEAEINGALLKLKLSSLIKI